MPTPARPLAEVVGGNCRRLRSGIGLTQDDLARYARGVGLRWRASSVADFEAGRSAPTLATVIAVAAALQLAAAERQQRARITLPDLIAADDDVAVTESLAVPGAALALVSVKNVSAELDSMIDALKTDLARRMRQLDGRDGVLARSGLAEARLAKGLGVVPEVLAAWTFQLWGGTFTEERDRRAGPAANRQKRGQVTRAMRDEILAAFVSGGENT